MLNADMTMNVVAMNIGCSSHAIRDLRLHFQAKARTKDRPRSTFGGKLSSYRAE